MKLKLLIETSVNDTAHFIKIDKPDLSEVDIRQICLMAENYIRRHFHNEIQYVSKFQKLMDSGETDTKVLADAILEDELNGVQL